MPDEFKSSPSSFLNVPVAIVIAGALIAGAIYFGNQSIGNPVGKAPAQPSTQAAAPAPAEPAVGAFREIGKEDLVRGASNARVTLIEYSDLECPFCKRFHPVIAQLLENYPNDVRWVYRHAPLAQLHSKAPKEAEAAKCAQEQGKGWEFVDKVFEVTPTNNGLDPAELPKIAAQVGVVNAVQFKSCLDSGKYTKAVADDLADATSAGMRGTPYSVVIGPQGQKLPVNGAVAYESLKATVDSVLK